MERSSGFDDDDDEEEFGGGRRDGASHKELVLRSDGKGGNMSDQRPSTPRSKHSVTEQRRRSKINDRFQILRDLIPHSDQKRDRASFLLEVIEYVRFLQEKVQKYEESYPGWTDENAKSTPWVKVYFRSFWNNARNSNQGPGDGIADPSQVLKNGSVPASFTFSGNDNSVPVAPAILSAEHNPTESDVTGIVAYKATENPCDFANKVTAVTGLQSEFRACSGRGIGVAQSQQLASDSDNLASQCKSQWLRPSVPIDCTVAGDILNEGEELAIDEGTISVSNTYSQELLTTLSQALQNSGINLSQATVSVQINLGKRATNKRPASTTISNAKDYDVDPSPANQTKAENYGNESEQASKRSKSNSSP